MNTTDTPTWPRLGREFWIVCGAAVVCVLPFLDKAYHIDDPVYLWVAQQIQAHPLDFFGFDKNWSWRIEPMYIINLNPPGISYFIAAAAFIVGWSEIALHLAFLVPLVAAVAGTYVLASRLCNRPGVAVWLAILTPGFMVCMTTIMCEPAMLAFYVWAIAAWIYGMDLQDRRALILAGILIGIGSLVKFILITAIPLLVAYTLARERKLTRTSLYLFIAMGIIASYNLYTSALYEVEAFSSAASLSVQFNAERSFDRFVNGGGRILSTLIYMGGCFASFAFVAPWLWGKRGLAGVLAMTVITVALVFSPLFAPFERTMFADAEPTFLRLLQTGIWAAAGLQLMGMAVVATWERREAESLLLLLLVLGIFAFSAFVNWTTNARSLLPMLPALAIIGARRTDRPGAQTVDGRWIGVPLAGAAALSMLVSWADYETAGVARTASVDVAEATEKETGTRYYSGQWGIRWYFEEQGFVGMAYEMEEDHLGRILEGEITALKGDVYVVHPYAGGFNPNVEFLSSHGTQLETLAYQRILPVSTHDFAAGAGFYSAHVGPLPFVFGPVNPETFEIYRLTDNVRQRYRFQTSPKGGSG